MTAGEKAQQGLTAEAGPGIDANQIRYGLGIGGEGWRKWTGWLQGHPLWGCIAGWSLQKGWGGGTRREGTEQEVAEAIAGELGRWPWRDRLTLCLLATAKHDRRSLLMEYGLTWEVAKRVEKAWPRWTARRLAETRERVRRDPEAIMRAWTWQESRDLVAKMGV